MNPIKVVNVRAFGEARLVPKGEKMGQSFPDVVVVVPEPSSTPEQEAYAGAVAHLDGVKRAYDALTLILGPDEARNAISQAQESVRRAARAAGLSA